MIDIWEQLNGLLFMFVVLFALALLELDYDNRCSLSFVKKKKSEKNFT